MIQKLLKSSKILRIHEAVPSSTFEDKAFANLEREHTTRIQLEKGEILLNIGELGDRFYAVESGSILAEDQGHVMHTFEPGSGFGENWLLFENQPAGATCRAGENGAVLLTIARDTFQREFKECFTVGGNFRGRVVRAKSTRKTRHLDQDIREFRGIHYADKDSRFALPKLKETHVGHVVDALEYGPECPQVSQQLMDMIAQPKVVAGNRPSTLTFVHNKVISSETREDFLCLNLYAPFVTSPSTFLPVMVWIHGGAFVTGAGSLPVYSGRELASKGAIVVTINYRLGALGFLCGVEGIPANLGLLDQITALRWVQKNIRSFGGDPNNVTVFGESAGGMSISCLLGSPIRKRERLFHKAVIQSGNAAAVFNQRQALKVKQNFCDAFMEKVKLPQETKLSKELLESCSMQTLIEVTQKVSVATMGKPFVHGIFMAFQPCCLENGPACQDLVFESQHPLVHIAQGIAEDVTVMIGVCASEYTLFMLDNGWKNLVKRAQESRKQFKQLMFKRMLTWVNEDIRYHPVPNVKERLEQILDFYLPASNDDRLTEEQAKFLFERVNSVWIFDLGVETLTTIKNGDGSKKPTYQYRIHHLCPIMDLGTPHSIDIPLMFGTFKIDRMFAMITGEGIETVDCSNEMIRSWISFAKNGNPGFPSTKPKVFGGNDKNLKLNESIFLTKEEQAIWKGFQRRVELDFDLCEQRAKL